MGRVKGRRNIYHTEDEILEFLKRNIAGESLMVLERESGIYNTQIFRGRREALENKRKPGITSAKYTRKKINSNGATGIQGCIA